MNNKSFIKYGIAVGILIIGLIIFTVVYNAQKTDENGISRFDWIQMLTEEFGISEYSVEEPYYKDVNADNPYFSSIQSAYEWNIVEQESSFRGEESADGKFIALTAMKAIGKYKIMIYMGLTDEPDEQDYLKLAIEEGLVSKEQLDKAVSEEDSRIILERASELYLSGLWKKDVAELQYRDNVREIERTNIQSINEDQTRIILSDDLTETLNAGDIIVFEEQETEQKSAKEVVSFRSDGSIELTDTSLDKVADSLIMSDMAEVRFEDILAYYNISDRNLTYNNIGKYDAKLVKHIDKSVQGDGFAIYLKTEEGKLLVELTDNNSGRTYKLSVNEKMNDEDSVEAKINIKNIGVGVQAFWTAEEGMEYTDVQVNADIEYASEISVEGEEIKIPLVKTPLYFGNGIAGVDIEFFLVLSAEGTISVEAGLPVKTAIAYEKGGGLRKHSVTCKYPEASVAISCTAELTIDVIPTIKILCWDALELGLDAGVSAEAEIESHLNSNIVSCADVNIALPILAVSVSLGDDAEKIFKEFSQGKFSGAEWEIFTEDNAPFKKEAHCEVYTDKSFKFVKECTYDEEKAETSLLESHRYMASFTSDFIDKGSYYEATGLLIDRAYIPIDVAEGMAVNEVYTFDGIEFAFTGKETIPSSLEPERYYFTDKLGNVYEAGGESYGMNGEMTSYVLEREMEDHEVDGIKYTNNYDIYIILDYNYTFKIPRDMAAEVIKGVTELDERDSSKKYKKLTDIYVYEWGTSYSSYSQTQKEMPGLYIDGNTLEIVDFISGYESAVYE